MAANTGVYYARDILHWQARDLWDRIADRRPFLLRFDDGEIDTTWAQTMFSWYYWNIVRRWPDTPLLVKHHLNGAAVSKGVENKLQQRLKESMREVHPDVPINVIYKMFPEATNALHNDTVRWGGPYENSADALDILDMIDHPDVLKAMDEFDGTKRGVVKLYKSGEHVFATDRKLGRSSLVQMHRNGQTKRAQVHQMNLARGFVSEINQRIFRMCIPVGYAHGLKRLSYTLMDSRTGSIAQIATTVPVEQSELYNREMQLVTYMVKHVGKEDCGATEGIPWTVRRSDLDDVLVGIYYKTESGSWRPIKKSDAHLCDKTIEIRNPATCMHPKDGHVCRFCIGDSVKDIDEHANPGFMLTIEQNRDTTQNTISTKHLLDSAVGESYTVDPFYRDYLDNEVDPNELVFAAPMYAKHVTLRLHVSDFLSLADISALPERALRNPSKVSEIREVDFIIDHGDNRQPEHILVPTCKGSFRPYLSRDMLAYMSEHGYLVDNQWVTVDMVDWDNNAAIMVFPQRRSSTLELLKDMKTAIFMTDAKSRLKAKRDINDPEVLADCLREVSELSNRKFTVNLSITAVIMYCMMVRSIRNNDFRLPKPWTLRAFAPQSKVMSGRSLSAKFAYSRQYEIIPEPNSYINRTRPDHNFDHLVVDVDAWNERNRIEADRMGYNNLDVGGRTE